MVVDGLKLMDTPDLDHESNTNPDWAVAWIVACWPWLKLPAPKTDPPKFAERERVYDLIEKFAVRDLASDIETVVVAEPELVTPSPVQPEKS